MLNICVVFSCLVAGQKSYRISTNNGLSTNNLTVIIKDRHDFMWMGSFNGVQKHEGARITVYTAAGADSLSLSSNEVHPVFEDREGFIWAGNIAGIDRIDPQTKLIRHYPSKSMGFIYSIFQDKYDSIWVDSDGGLFRLNPETGIYSQVKSGGTTKEGIPEFVSGFKATVTTDAGIWLYTVGGMVFYDYASQQFFHRYNNPQKKEIFDIEPGYKAGANGELITDGKGHLFFIAEKSVLIKYDMLRDTITRFPFALHPEAWQCCYAMAIDFHNNIWIGFRQAGILIFDQATQKFNPVFYEGVNSLIGSNYVYSFAEDYQQHMWVTTSNGVFVIDLYDNGIKEITISERKEIIDYGGGMLTEDDKGNIYLPHSRGGMTVLEANTSTLSYYPVSKGFRSYNFLFQDQSLNLWMAADKNLYPAIFKQGGVSIDSTKMMLPSVKALSPKPVVWADKIGTNLFAKTQDGQIFPFINGVARPPLQGVGWRKQMCLSADSTCLFYLNRNLDIVRYHIAGNTADTFSKKPQLHQVEFDYFDTRDMVDDGRGQVWVTTQNGLIRYRLKDHTSQVYTLKDGLSNAFSFALCRDRNKNIWVASLGGIDLYNPEKNNFSTLHSLPSTNYQDALGTGIILKNGNVAFQVGNRLILIDPDKVPARSHSSMQLKVQSIEVNGRPVDASQKLFILSHYENQLRVRFGLLDFENASKVNYFYKMNGNGGEWKPLGNQSELYFFSLSPGKYKLQIKAVDGSGYPVQGEQTLSFNIHPPFYKTAWFLSILLLLAFLGGLWLYLNFRRKYRNQKLLNRFITSLSGQAHVNDMAIDIAENCIKLLGFSQCTVYLLDEDKRALVPTAGRSAPGAGDDHFLNHTTLALSDERLVHIAQKGHASVIRSRAGESKYLVKETGSELFVPIAADKNVYGMIYSCHHASQFFTRQQVWVLEKVAGVSTLRISKYFTEERLRSKIAQDLHDDLGSALSSININSKMAIKNTTPQKVNEYLQNIQFNSRHMMESLSDIVWAIDPQNDTLEQLIIRMKEFAAEILEPLNIEYRFTEELPRDGMELDLTQRKNLYLIFKESINNAAKYSQCKMVEVQLKNDSQQTLLFVKDDGKGFDRSRIKEGNGLGNMQERASDMGACIEILTSEGQGTVVQVKLASHD
ncbi:MAG: ATP-binding protein [Bacteroidota bacterium]